MEFLDAAREIEDGRSRFTFRFPGTVIVPANGTATLTLAVPSDSHFWVEYITGKFTTLDVAGADGGACLIDMTLSDSGKKPLIKDFCPLDLIFSPGRVRSSGVAGDPSNNLFFPIDMSYMFEASSTIEMSFASRAATANRVDICFHGVKYRAKAIGVTVQ